MIKVMLFHGKGFVSSMIRWFTRSPYSHAALYFPKSASICEAWQGDTVRFKPWNYNWTGVELYELNRPLTPEESTAIMNFCLREKGCRYDYLSVLSFLTRSPRKSDTRWFCSELTYAAFQAAGINLLADGVNAWEVSPGMLANSPLLKRVEHD
jgi:uncharacterized protein YycO